MKLISIKTATGQTEIISVEHIVSIVLDFSNVVISLSNGSQVKTKFDNLDEAIQYIVRATEDPIQFSDMTGTIQ
jgi:ABC-type branched-subunit amino acid transport system ATPase component